MMTFFSQIAKKHPIHDPKNTFSAQNDKEAHSKNVSEEVFFDTSSHQYLYISDLYGPSTETPIYAACAGVNRVSFAPILER